MAKKQSRTRSSRSSKSKSLKRKSGFSRLQFAIYIAVFALIGAFTLWVSFAAPTSCTQNAPAVSADNNYAWAQPGSWGYPGQKLQYFMQVRNYDVGCGSSTFTVNVTAPDGYTVSIPTNTVSVNSASNGYLSAYVTSPTTATDGDVPLNFSVVRNSTGIAGNGSTNYYKVYTSDTTIPTLFWNNPSEGQILSKKGHSTYNVQVSSSDNHAVKSVDIYLDGVLKSTTNCDDTTYICQAVYRWSLSKNTGSHTARFVSRDWFGNSAEMSLSFSVQ